MLILFPRCHITCFASWVPSEGMNTLPQWSLFTQPLSAEAGQKDITAQLLQPIPAVLLLLLSGDVAAPGRPALPTLVQRWWVHLKEPSIQLILSPVDKEGHSLKEFQNRTLEREDLVKEW